MSLCYVVQAKLCFTKTGSSDTLFTSKNWYLQV